jgi:hypothetical protein
MSAMKGGLIQYKKLLSKMSFPPVKNGIQHEHLAWVGCPQVQSP